MKRILNISMIIILSVGVILMLGFINRRSVTGSCDNIQVQIERPDGNMYISEDEIKDQIKIICNSDLTQEISIEKIAAIEENIKKNSVIKTCEIYLEVNGTLNAKITQRRPIGRVMNSRGESFYLDETGFMIPAIAGRPAHVVIANGNINESYAPNPYFIDNDSAAAISILDEIYKIMKFIDKYPFWKAQIEQIYVDNQKQFILIPKVGHQEIHLGNADHIEGKLKKLELFYTKGMTNEGWRGYQVIDVQFKNQIICRGANVLYATKPIETEIKPDTTQIIVQ